MKRIKLKDRMLPRYSRGEEVMNMATHIIGGGIGVLGLALCLYRALQRQDPLAVTGALIYGCSCHPGEHISTLDNLGFCIWEE